MNKKKEKDPGDEPYLKVLRPLVETYFAFLRKEEPHIKALGLTPAQFDVVATLGDTEGMNTCQLSDETLVTKGTLTGVLDRLEKMGLIERVYTEKDRRQIIIRLTKEGVKCFERVFPDQIYFLKPYFENALDKTEMETLRGLLLKLKESFEKR